MLSVAQVSFFSDPQCRSPEDLLSAWPTLVQVAEAAAASGVRVTVLQASQHWHRLRSNDVDYHFLPFGGVASTSAGIAAFRDLAATLRPDVFHVQGLGFPREVTALAAAAPGVPIVVQDHADRPPRRFWRWPAVRRSLAAARGVLFCAREQARPFRRIGLLPNRTRVYEVPESTCGFTALDQAEARTLSGVSGDPALLWAAAQELGLDWSFAAPAEREGLIEFGQRVCFRHPLVRAAAYRAAPIRKRLDVHRALAEVTDPIRDPDRRAWHRASSTVTHDEGIAFELERAAGRAKARGSLLTAAAILPL